MKPLFRMARVYHDGPRTTRRRGGRLENLGVYTAILCFKLCARLWNLLLVSGRKQYTHGDGRTSHRVFTKSRTARHVRRLILASILRLARGALQKSNLFGSHYSSFAVHPPPMAVIPRIGLFGCRLDDNVRRVADSKAQHSRSQIGWRLSSIVAA